jgi:putative two-component system response regulator
MTATPTHLRRVAAAPERHIVAHSGGTAEVAAATARILVVDDQDSNVQVLRRILARAGYLNVHSTTDSTAVAALCAAEPPDLLLLDLHMPGRDGFLVLNDLAPHISGGGHLPVIMLTGDTTTEVKRRALSRGAKDFVSKPFDAAEVLLRIRNLLETRLLYQALARQNAELEATVRERTFELEASRLEVLERLATAAEFRDDETGRHTQRVGELAARLARAHGLPPARVHLIRLAAPLHDVGKIAVPDDVLRKPGRLTPDEFAVMQTHTVRGSEMLGGGGSDLVALASRIALSHHERWDGSGYPNGVAGDAIPLEARIVAVADVMDALSHDRPYRAAWPLSEVLAEIRRGRGTHFDPAVVDTFFQLLLPAGRLSE